MFQAEEYTDEKAKNYELVLKQLTALSEGVHDEIAVLANASALLNQFLTDINWVGFYLWKNDELVLGPFQGLPACIRIGYGKGVCGTAIKEKKTMRIANVLESANHIFCDGASLSEIVIPLTINGQTYGVLDIDSPITNRFDSIDEKYLEQFAEIVMNHIQ